VVESTAKVASRCAIGFKSSALEAGCVAPVFTLYLPVASSERSAAAPSPTSCCTKPVEGLPASQPREVIPTFTLSSVRASLRRHSDSFAFPRTYSTGFYQRYPPLTGC
jgi:hypothetical protein